MTVNAVNAVTPMMTESRTTHTDNIAKNSKNIKMACGQDGRHDMRSSQHEQQQQLYR